MKERMPRFHIFMVRVHELFGIRIAFLAFVTFATADNHQH